MNDTQQPSTIYLKDYQVPPFLIDKTDLVFDLSATATSVTATLSMRRNPEFPDTTTPLVLHGGDEVKLIAVAIDDYQLPEAEYSLVDHDLVVTATPDVFTLTIETLINPQANTRLEGLYRSSSMFCTQCEAEGFRHITYYLDRPDVMSIFTTKIIAEQGAYPVMLANGNQIETGILEEGKHFAVWHDPFPKPAYLFALVAGDLAKITDTFTTMSGKSVQLEMYTEDHNIDKVDYAMDSLKRSMKWDEEVYGREYDLDIFMVVAVDDFNMGAMENKGLNIFNSSCLLASPTTTTDDGYLRVEAVVAHEYFHNWSGNRVTCRDWFQLSLKEGFTVFRDQMFSADMNSAVVKRVEDVAFLRTAQFAEDAGPMAHPVRPASFIEISNFYTLTVYEKGAEIVRMLHTLLGEEAFRKGSDLYFSRHDGQAVTCDDFLAAMQDASGVNLTQFARWYSQAGTPKLTVTSHYDAEQQNYQLTVLQMTPVTPNQPTKLALHIPIKVGLIGRDGTELTTAHQGISAKEHTLHLTELEQTFEFKGVSQDAVPSLLRGFSAPVKLDYAFNSQELLLLMSSDSDGFNRWNACQQLAVNELLALIEQVKAGEPLKTEFELVQGFASILQDDTLDPAMVALMLSLPTAAYLSELVEEIDPQAIAKARKHLKETMAKQLSDLLLACYHKNHHAEPYAPTPKQMAKRSLKNAALGYLAVLEVNRSLVQEQLAQADNMTDEFAALNAAVHNKHEQADNMLADFYSKWSHEALVVNKWLMLMAGQEHPQGLQRIKNLMTHDAFDLKNPNKIRSLLGGLGQNIDVFHNLDGSGYEFLADLIIELDKKNPQIASRLCTPLTRWRKMKPELSALMEQQLQRIMAEPLSKDVYEVVAKSLT
ncbi:aminopeptidase N [Marinomonas agarivorans]|nr:aminopeptidase N [Marinomonas agarivorans]